MELALQQWRAMIGREARYHSPRGRVCTQLCDKLTSKSASCFWKRGGKLPQSWFISFHHSHTHTYSPTHTPHTHTAASLAPPTLNRAISLNLKPNHLIVFALKMTLNNMWWSVTWDVFVLRDFMTVKETLSCDRLMLSFHSQIIKTPTQSAEVHFQLNPALYLK